MTKNSNLTVRVLRGPITESLHIGHAVVVNTQGEILYSAGDPNFVTYARSTAKLIQAIPVVESGAANHYHLTDKEVALLCASHNGEEKHVEIAQSILSKIGLTSDALTCGIHDPFHAPTTKRMRAEGIPATPLHNNCSGKHSAMLALAMHVHAPTKHYASVNHPVQQLMRQTVSEMSGVPLDELIIGVDGCGVPVFGMGIHQLALAYARLGNPEGLEPKRADACRRIIGAIKNEPYYLAGSERFDTTLAEVTKGRIIGKLGAESVYAITIPEKGWGIVLKIQDGSKRALEPAAAEVLHELGLLSEEELQALDVYRLPTTRNWQGTLVGAIVPEATFIKH
ncbi:asparaginase [Paenibacillus sp. N1-5-1-14]|uniref:asparaginase n=1 Tax=Paenibacillus radicibacter TaxID=2972488 RepID=UPI00215998FB|nr:asparaginase [Paenibacillus radicibacter]MCR8641734.1 asparaginase [Paenibacillus radicibacter]